MRFSKTHFLKMSFSRSSFLKNEFFQNSFSEKRVFASCWSGVWGLTERNPGAILHRSIIIIRVGVGPPYLPLPPPLHPGLPGRARSVHGTWVERWGRGRDHPLTLATPINAPGPTPTTPRTLSLCLPSESQVEAVQEAESGSDWGGVGGLGG